MTEKNSKNGSNVLVKFKSNFSKRETVDPILHYTYDRTCSSASIFYHLPYARYSPSSYYRTHSIPAYLSTSQPLTVLNMVVNATVNMKTDKYF